MKYFCEFCGKACRFHLSILGFNASSFNSKVGAGESSSAVKLMEAVTESGTVKEATLMSIYKLSTMPIFKAHGLAQSSMSDCMSETVLQSARFLHIKVVGLSWELTNSSRNR
ncbi:hypothetical protein RND81_08G050300 [Saponaria officinalis]|uniref:Uncharacterized protein n=1 Tax=Saponaria officinalis TaxID=3572 RepID=A0AAW1J4X7_SAPOF